MMTVLEGFQYRIARWIAGMTAREVGGREWGWTLVDVEFEVTGMWQMRKYMWRRQATIEYYVVGRPK